MIKNEKERLALAVVGDTPMEPMYGSHQVKTLSLALALATAYATSHLVPPECNAKFREIARLIRKACE